MPPLSTSHSLHYNVTTLSSSSPLAPPAIPRACFATVTSDSSTTDHKKCRFEQKRPFFQWCAKMQRPFSQLLCCHSLTLLHIGAAQPSGGKMLSIQKLPMCQWHPNLFTVKSKQIILSKNPFKYPKAAPQVLLSTGPTFCRLLCEWGRVFREVPITDLRRPTEADSAADRVRKIFKRENGDGGAAWETKP